MEELVIDKMIEKDWDDISRIYIAGIATKNATFEKQAPDWTSWDAVHRKDCRIVAKIANKVVGWAALSNVSSRCVYSGVAEVSIYIDAEYHRRGIGDKLLKSLIEESEAHGIWTLQAGMFPENEGSMRLHQKHGFSIVGIREKIGIMDDIWRDTILLERRSKIVGIG